jgi:hypothetical protein
MQEAAKSYKTSPHFYKAAWRHIYKQAVLVFTAIRNLHVTQTHNYFHKASISSRENMSINNDNYIIISIILCVVLLFVLFLCTCTGCANDISARE